MVIEFTAFDLAIRVIVVPRVVMGTAVNGKVRVGRAVACGTV